MDAFLQSLLGGSVVSVVGGFLLHFQKERIAAAVKRELEVGMSVFRSQRSWKEASLAELLGPMTMQFDRTGRAMRRWQAKNLFLEQQVIGEGNRTVRDLLLTKGHLIPPDLMPHAGRLVEHYDLWLEEFDRLRGEQNPRPDAEFVFVGPLGYAFPKDAEAAFVERFRRYQQELYESA